MRVQMVPMILCSDLSFRQSGDKPDNESVSSESDLESEIIYDQANCPKVEVLSENGVPQKILIHLEDEKILQIQCNY